ncbi:MULTISPECIES: hypothetical protein [Burkholderia]|uniref:Uncharacterized protein n=2 Tax=Burkholderia cepacia complex TaxID=87882 RepID=A0AAP1V5X5_9BURK|nr:MULTISPECIES: hypothetical protein [Burkholderia]MBK1902215.1 hypothetical protein [Burkholderia contaminans]MBK1910498.1 hypothetical protein [Burkholderia contaminans]MBK1923957.1 hypothetical protein [Burkholderia contaminans]MBK1932169.1 hypothetical protein [Burkholderia contaminans]MBK1939418.1 hypothetical protein [Burkholderia contaminans]
MNEEMNLEVTFKAKADNAAPAGWMARLMDAGYKVSYRAGKFGDTEYLVKSGDTFVKIITNSTRARTTVVAQASAEQQAIFEAITKSGLAVGSADPYAEQGRPHDDPYYGKLPDAKVVILPDGYNGHTMKFFADPVQVDGNVVKLRCAEPGKEYMTAWRDRAAVQAAVAAQVGSLPEVARRDDVFALRNALREVLMTSKATNKVAEAAQEKAYAAYLASFTTEEKAYVVSAARLWQKEKGETGFFQHVELDSFEGVVRNLGRGLVHDFVTAAQAKAVLRSVIAPDVPNGVDWTVSVEMSVTADSAEQAAKFALDDVRDLTLEEINVDVQNVDSGRIVAVSVKNAMSQSPSFGM